MVLDLKEEIAKARREMRLAHGQPLPEEEQQATQLLRSGGIETMTAKRELRREHSKIASKSHACLQPCDNVDVLQRSGPTLLRAAYEDWERNQKEGQQ